MTGTPAAAVFFSLLAVVLTWLTWFLLWRDYRVDLLRHRLDVLAERFRGDRALVGFIDVTSAEAARLIWTRLLLLYVLRKCLKSRDVVDPSSELAALLVSHFRPFVRLLWVLHALGAMRNHSSSQATNGRLA